MASRLNASLCMHVTVHYTVQICMAHSASNNSHMSVTKAAGGLLPGAIHCAQEISPDDQHHGQPVLDSQEPLPAVQAHPFWLA